MYHAIGQLEELLISRITLLYLKLLFIINNNANEIPL